MLRVTGERKKNIFLQTQLIKETDFNWLVNQDLVVPFIKF